MPTKNYIAVDLGAGSGRVMLGQLDRGELRLQEHGRFEHTPVELGGQLRWTVMELLSRIRRGVATAADAAGGKVRGISTDCWGVDYVLSGKGSPMLAPPTVYRDERTAATYEKTCDLNGQDFIFEQTGIQFMPINTLYQLLAEPGELMEQAERFTLLGDWFNGLLCTGETPTMSEISMASTTQLFDVRKRDWAWPLIEKVGLRRELFPEVIDSGTVIGEHAIGAQVIATCTHDTACAVAAVPAEGDNWAFLSAGTWSLLGVERDEPIVTERCRELNFTNELGYDGMTRLLKNISGLFILQQCRADWQSDGRDLGWHYLAKLADNAPPLSCLIRPEHPSLGVPCDMPKAIADYLRATKQPVPTNMGGFVRCIYESLALLYRKTLGELRELTGRSIETLHVVGGGGQARLLNQLVADATALPTVVGPIEATAMGNLLIQAATLGDLDKSDIRTVVRNSQRVETFNPRNTAAMDEAYRRFVELPVE